MLRHKRSVESLQPQQDRHQASNRYKNHQLESAAAAERRFAERQQSSANQSSGYRKLINNNAAAAADQLESDDTQDLEDNWRETAQIFTDDDQFLFQEERQRNNKVSKQHQTRKLRSQQQSLQNKNKKSPPYVQQKQRRVPVYLENVARSTPESGQSRDTNSADNEADDDELDEDDQDDDDDDNSSISFAQSGCHSILSAWRIKAANRAARRLARNNQQQQSSSSNRPTSVLSNGSSAITKKSILSTAFSSRGKSPASQTRIALGPAQAQHFVTNSRRRRQANELILETLEARRRALALSRQNTASLFGSASYLDTIGIADGGAAAGSLFNDNITNPTTLVTDSSTGGLIQASSDDYGNTRLSLSPSPIGRRGDTNLSPARAQFVHHRGAPMSDLGTTSRNSSSNNNNKSLSPTSTSAREKRLIAGVNYATKRSKESLNNKSKSPTAAAAAAVTKRRPPLAKLDQNSSDLYSSNSSSSDSSESSGSQFTQLVTSELTPDCILLDEQVLRQSAAKQQRLLTPNDKQHIPYRQQQQQPLKNTRETFKRTSSLKDSSVEPPKVPERTKRKQKQHKSGPSPELEETTQHLELKTESELEKQEGFPRLRRNTLRRDSIRRLRLSQMPSQQQQQQDQSAIDSSSDVASFSKPNTRISEQSSPHLNRGYFRTNSARTINGGELNSSTDLSTPKRNSWLFGSSRSSSNKNDIEATEIKPRIFSAARRSNSSEHLATNKTNKFQQQQQQQQQQQKEEVRQVERMLRQMKPNQVFTSYARDENSEMSSIQNKSQNAPNTLTRMRAKSSELPSTNSSFTNTRPRSIATSGRCLHHDDYDDVTSPTRMVRESNVKKSLNNSKFDQKNDNGRQYEVEERIKYEKSSLTMRNSNLGGKEEIKTRSQNMISRTETKRSTSNISPPIEFADPKQLKSTSHHHHQQQQPSRAYKLDDRQTSFQASREPVRNISDRNTSRSKSPLIQQQQQQQQIEPKTSYVRRALSEERPAIVARRSVPSMNELTKSQKEQLNNKLSTTNTTHTTNKLKQQQQQQQQVDNKIRQEQPSLPKFERTADDEFKKRVDYLRKLAHANLSDEPLISRATTKQKLAEKPLTKPMSTNWRQSSGSQEEKKENDEKVVGRKLLDSLHQSTSSGNNKWTSHNLRPSTGDYRSKECEHARNVAMTNIDTLLADRYQLPLSESSPHSEFKWRRSNSSLASLPSSRSKLISEQQKPSQTGLLMSSSSNNNKPQQQDQHLRAQSALSSSQQQALQSSLIKPRELTSSAVVKLVVKEKSAPKLDYAHVEQQPRPQLQQPSGRQQAVDNNSQQSKQTKVSQHVLGTKQAPQISTTWATARPMLRVASPKSPDFGVTATSSNDDSAIASSVSSPSLSFVMNQPAANEQQTRQSASQVANRSSVGRSTSPVASSKPSIAPRVRSGNLPVVQRVEESSIGNVGALQGILRRQQQQQQQHQQISQDTSSESSSLRPQQVAETSELIGKARARDEPSSLRSPDHTRTFRSQSEESTTNLTTSTKETNFTETRGLAQEDNLQQQQQEERECEQVGGSGTRRVHFNDKTSIRSFESISSLASNSTAVPNDNLRQQVGSPDSMGSGSTSRLSAESPDLRKTSGAAIYAVRGDPELELEQPNNLMAIHQQVIQQQQQRQPIQYVPRYQTAGHPAMVQAQSCVPYLRMTAPPSISTGTPPQQCSPQQVSSQPPPPSSSSSSTSHHVQYIVRPTSLTSTQIVPTRAVMNTPPSKSMLNNPPPMVVKQSVVAAAAAAAAADDDDDLYALRLRQAATSRVFNYASGVPSGSPVISQQQLPSPVHLSPAQQSTATIISGQKKPSQSSQQQQQQQQRHLKDLRNYQTEV